MKTMLEQIRCDSPLINGVTRRRKQLYKEWAMIETMMMMIDNDDDDNDDGGGGGGFDDNDADEDAHAHIRLIALNDAIL